MGTLNNPGMFDCLKKLQENPDMPYFLLLASDPIAPKIVRNWAASSINEGIHNDKVPEAFEVAGAMEAWKLKNPDK